MKFIWPVIGSIYFVQNGSTSQLDACDANLLGCPHYFHRIFSIRRSPLMSMALFATLVAFFSATQDIAIDAYRREYLKDEELGFGSSMNVWLSYCDVGIGRPGHWLSPLRVVGPYMEPTLLCDGCLHAYRRRGNDLGPPEPKVTEAPPKT
ncbi:MAG: hypothetical protein IPM97_00005 [Bdellovibrionaceae bacterium]|nr:hypothetical protein [Pseudobdellovibrionaceae bacterium]